MLSKTILPALSLLSIFTSTSTAFPQRAHCICTIVDGTGSQLRLSSIPSQTSPSSPSSLDICSTLGPELESFRHSHPERYSDFISDASITRETEESATATDGEKPLSTAVLLALAAKHGFQNPGAVLPSASMENSPGRIVCRNQVERVVEAYQDSVFTLLALHVIVGFVMLACIAEGFMLALRLLSSRYQHQTPNGSALRLNGEERHLRAFHPFEVVPSPGMEKKLRAYSSPDWMPKASSEKREFEAYLDEDDEMSKPVM